MIYQKCTIICTMIWHLCMNMYELGCSIKKCMNITYIDDATIHGVFSHSLSVSPPLRNHRSLFISVGVFMTVCALSTISTWRKLYYCWWWNSPSRKYWYCWWRTSWPVLPTINNFSTSGEILSCSERRSTISSFTDGEFLACFFQIFFAIFANPHS